MGEVHVQMYMFVVDYMLLRVCVHMFILLYLCIHPSIHLYTYLFHLMRGLELAHALLCLLQTLAQVRALGLSLAQRHLDIVGAVGLTVSVLWLGGGRVLCVITCMCVCVHV